MWWFNFDCGSSVELYARNAALYTSNPAPRLEDAEVVPQKVASELHPRVRNHGEGPY